MSADTDSVSSSRPQKFRSSPFEERKLFPLRSGRLLGIIVGILVGICAFPPVRSVFLSQLQFTLIQERTPWLRAMDTRRLRREVPFLDVTAASAPNDYLMQVGRATVTADLPIRLRRSDGEEEDRTLTYLAVVAKDFPTATGIYAHLTRAMMRDRFGEGEKGRGGEGETREQGTRNRGQDDAGVGRQALGVNPQSQTSTPSTDLIQNPKSKIQNSPSLPFSPSPPLLHGRDAQLMRWALKRGELGDPENAYWQATLAVVEFAAGNENDGLKALRRAANGKLRWDAYLYEEVLGQWRLFSAAYGDRGAMQKIGPLSLLAFPHLRELRNMAERVRGVADRAEVRGDVQRAVRIRLELARLGLLMRDTAQWAYEALVGTDIFFLAMTDSNAKIPTGTIRRVGQWETAAKGVIALLHRAKRGYEIDKLKQEADSCGMLRDRVDVARYDATYPGVPPGIPLRELFGSWMLGVCLAQQGLALCAVFGVFLCVRLLSSGNPLSKTLRKLAFWGAGAAGSYAGMIVFGGNPTLPLMTVFLACLGIWGVLLVSRWQRYEHSDELTPDELASVRWTSGTTLRLLCLVFLPGLFALIALRPALTALHPVALMLTGMLDVPHTAHAETVLLHALCAFALPLLIIVALCGWAMVRRVRPLSALSVGLPRIFLPSLCVLLVSYVLTLNQTLQWDAEVSRSINLAAQNDLNWVLTHSDPDDTETTE